MCVLHIRSQNMRVCMRYLEKNGKYLETNALYFQGMKERERNSAFYWTSVDLSSSQIVNISFFHRLFSFYATVYWGSSLPLTHIFICQLGILLYQCIYGIYSSNSLLSISTYSSIHNLSYGSVSVYIMGYGGDIHVCISLSLSHYNIFFISL